MNNTQFSQLRRECFLHPHKQHPWNRWPQGQKDTLKPWQKYLSLAGGSPANFPGTCQLPSLLLDKGKCFLCSLVHGKWSEDCTSTRRHHPRVITSPLGSAVSHTELPKCSHSWHKITGLGTALQLVHGKSNAFLREALLSVRHYKCHVPQAPCTPKHECCTADKVCKC